jgi:hypothetical protein
MSPWSSKWTCPRWMVLKDDGYNMKLVSTYGILHVPADAKVHKPKIGNETKIFYYTEPFHNHYKFSHAVDDHNNNRHSYISIEETWVTHTWENRVFAFLLAITEINSPLLHLVIFHYFRSAVGLKRDSNTDHELQTAPPHAHSFVAGKWICKAKDAYKKLRL